jgi:RNA polymerase sigma-70 factor (ECF subfamily)
VLVLLFLEGLSVDEIAAVVAVPPGTVKSRIYHAKRALRALMGLRS